MTTLDKHPSGGRVKMAYIGLSGSGKTGSLASLVNDKELTKLYVERYRAEQELFILDLEDGLDPLRGFVKPENYKRVHFKTFTEPMRFTSAGQIRPKAPEIQEKVVKALDKWVDEEGDFGSIYSWGPERILVIDTFTAYGIGLLRWVRMLNSRLSFGDRDWRDYGGGQELEHEFLDMLMDKRIKCSVIVISHIAFIEGNPMDPVVSVEVDKDGNPIEHRMERGYPMALGKKSPPQVGRHFNSVILAHSKPRGQGVERVIRTQSFPNIELKNPFSGELKAELPLETGLATIFKTYLTHGHLVTEEPSTEEENGS